MATYPFDFSVPSPAQTATGSQKTGVLMPTLASAINAAHAVNAGALISQSFTGWIDNQQVGSHFIQDSDSNSSQTGEAFVWLVPALSSAHTVGRAILDFVRFTSSSSLPNVAGTIQIRTFVQTNTDDEFKLNSSTIAASIAVDASVPVDTLTSRTVDIHLPFDEGRPVFICIAFDWPDYIEGGTNDGTSIVLRKFQLFSKPLSSPLPAGLVSTRAAVPQLEPLGQGATKPGSPFAAALGLSIIEGLEAIDRRDKVLTAYSRCRIPSRLTTFYANAYGQNGLLSPVGLSQYSTSLVRNYPQQCTILLRAKISPPPGAVANATFSASFAVSAPGRDEYPESSQNPECVAIFTASCAVDSSGNPQATYIVETLTVATTAMMGPLQNRYLRVGILQPDDPSTAANVDYYTFMLRAT